MQGLRVRLFVSYLLLLAITLGVIGGALVLILNTRDAPPEPTYQQLATLALSVRLRDVLNVAGFDQIFPTQRDFDSLTAALSQLADDRQVRILLADTEAQTILYDSEGIFQANDHFDGRIERYIIPATIMRNAIAGINSIRGTFTDPDNEDWLFVGIESLRQRQNQMEQMASQLKSVGLEDIFARIQAGQVKDLNVILKADVQGSIGAIEHGLSQVNAKHSEVQIKVLHTGTGAISESDVNLATASSAWVVTAAAAVSIATEWVQLYSHMRFPMATDVACNVIGCWAGLTVAYPGRYARHAAQRSAGSCLPPTHRA